MDIVHNIEFLRAEYERIRAKGYLLAGDLNDLPQRASVYYHLYEDSGGRNVFPLIAAHGALWASGYFSKGMRIGRFLALQYCFNFTKMRDKMQLLSAFANAFRDINRRVCAEAYAIYHFSKLYGDAISSSEIIPSELLQILNECHSSQRSGNHFDYGQRLKLFSAFFLWEQETIVAPAVADAIKEFDWPLVKCLAMKPCIEFSYFGKGGGLQFFDFSSKVERIELGIQAFKLAEHVGVKHVKHVEQALQFYKILPLSFFKDTSLFFTRLQENLTLHRCAVTSLRKEITYD
ncbi:hypothetical protein [Cellvibrio fibrivorans]|uniref:Uncharacterized protein n=1 Tax=Cellvibrio fibrivorans TaxID=126350 RepID=A0ABU1V145_9GAMM|nr:hypothetical protein [Cellvibrio fibrivorans]MDR7091157.1 hypothetical protein [Cellvibrio fibrivorans]